MLSLPNTRRSTGVVILTSWVVLVFLSYYFLYLPNQESLVSAIVRKLDRTGGGGKPSAAEREQLRQWSRAHMDQLLRERASNRTLGLDSIQFLNLPHRHDRFDAAALQGYLSDIDIEHFPAVSPDDIRDRGLPPTSRPNALKPGEIGCYRAHANVWRHMLERRIPAVLILESDAAWDVNLRPIMGALNGPFRELLVHDNPHLFQAANGSEGLPQDPDDPWAARTGLWDILTLGHCIDRRNQKSDSWRMYDDPWGPDSGFKFVGLPFQEPLRRQRVVFRSERMACTTGYIISTRGAAKLLARTAYNLDVPVDLIMDSMGTHGELTVYSVQQRIVVQWAYRAGLGMAERGTQSDINSETVESKDGGGWDMSGWDQAHKTKNVWDYRETYENAGFANFALQQAWKLTVEGGH